MIKTWSRRRWMQAVGGVIGLGAAPAVRGLAQEPAETEGDSLKAFPKQDPRLVQQTVGASHGRFEKVRELVLAYPELAKGSWDWGFGDWESPIEAAAHTGRREIALFLMEHGARPNLFTFAMLGDLDTVKALLKSQPAQLSARGPHSLSLLHHARVGGEQAQAVVDFLESAGAKDVAPEPATAEEVERWSGDYLVEGIGARVAVETGKNGISFRGPDGNPRRLFRLADGTWHPAGAPSVRFRFEPAEGLADAVIFTMGDATFRAVR